MEGTPVCVCVCVSTCVCDSTKTQTEVVNPSHSTIEHNTVLWTFSLIVSYQTDH